MLFVLQGTGIAGSTENERDQLAMPKQRLGFDGKLALAAQHTPTAVLGAHFFPAVIFGMCHGLPRLIFFTLCSDT